MTANSPEPQPIHNDSEMFNLMHSELCLAEIYSDLARLGAVKWPDIRVSRDYVGGLVDGEGHIGVCRHVRKSTSRPQYITRVQVAIREKEVIDPLVHFGGVIKKIDNSRWNQNATGIYSWTIHSRQAQHFLLAILPSLRNPNKIAAAKRVLEFEFLRKSVSGGHVVDKARIPKQELLYREIVRTNSGKSDFSPIEDEHLLARLEALRHGNPASEHIPDFTGVEEELADVIIRILDYSAARNLRLWEAVRAKMAYNETRPVRHGKLF